MADDKKKIDDAKRAGKISVRGPEGGRWRAGRHFTREAIVLDLADVSAEHLAEIEADGELSVGRVA